MTPLVLVTGGAGFIGSAVVRASLGRGWHVRILDNLSNGYEENIPDSSSVATEKGDIRSKADVLHALEGVSIVFHLAAVVGNVRSLEDPLADADTNVMGTRQLLACMRESGVTSLIYSSSAAIFGEPVHLPIREDHPVEPLSPYGVSKLAAEKDALCFGRAYGWTVAALRYFNAYGCNQRYDAYGNVIPIFARRLREGKRVTIYGDGEQTRDFVHVDDIAEANCLAAERRVSGTFNIGSGQATTINGVAREIHFAMQRPVSASHAEPRAGEARHSVADITRARTVLGYEPRRSLSAGLQEYADWFLAKAF